MNNTLKSAKNGDLPNTINTNIIFGVIFVNDNTCVPSIDALRTIHGDNSCQDVHHIALKLPGTKNTYSRSYLSKKVVRLL